MADRSPPTSSEAAFEVRLTNALNASHALSPDRLDANDLDVLVHWLVQEHAATPIQIDPSTFHVIQEESRFLPSTTPSLAPHPFRVTLRVHATGATSAIAKGNLIGKTTVEKFSNAPDRTELSRRIDVVSDEGLTSARLAELRDDWLRGVGELVSAANEDIEFERNRMEAQIRRVVEPTHKRRRLLVSAASGAGISLSLVDDSPMAIPLQPGTLTLASANAAATSGASEVRLSEEIADSLVEMTIAFSRALERMPATADQIIGRDEESMRDVLLFLFNANWQGTVTAETFVGRGKTDILLRWRDRDAFIGECKIWNGPAHFNDGLTQLLERYTVWRATRVAMILFIREIKDQTAIIDKARRTIVSHPRYIRTKAGSSPEAFELFAQRDRSRVVTLNLVPVIVPSDAGRPRGSEDE